MDRWGLTPSQVDDLPADAYFRIRAIAELRDVLAIERAQSQQEGT